VIRLAAIVALCIAASGCAQRFSETKAQELRARCVELGGVPRVVRIERGPRLGEIHDVQCRDLPDGGPDASDTTWIAL
jgi:hypothetical protein